MSDEVLFFFGQHMEALPLYEAFEGKVMEEIENVRIKVQKSQIPFYNKHLFACVSFAKVRKKKDCPPAYHVMGKRSGSVCGKKIICGCHPSIFYGCHFLS